MLSCKNASTPLDASVLIFKFFYLKAKKDKMSNHQQQNLRTNEDEKLLDKKNKEKSTMVGIGSWTPSWLQWMANIKWFLPFISIFCLVQG